LSLLLVTYNTKNTFASLDSVTMQKTDFDFEIVVADDHSQDSTVAIIEECAAVIMIFAFSRLSERWNHA